jgi:hypothetical protein
MHLSIDFGDLPFSMCLARSKLNTHFSLFPFPFDIRLKWCSIDIVRATCCARPCLRHSAARFESLLSLLASRSRIALYSRGILLAMLALSQADKRLIVLSGCRRHTSPVERLPFTRTRLTCVALHVRLACCTHRRLLSTLARDVCALVATTALCVIIFYQSSLAMTAPLWQRPPCVTVLLSLLARDVCALVATTASRDQHFSRCLRPRGDDCLVCYYFYQSSLAMTAPLWQRPPRVTLLLSMLARDVCALVATTA